MGLKAGTTTNLNNSMAKAMEDAFIAEWLRVKEDQAAPEMTEDMRLIFVAVAQGVINHLKANQNAFEVLVTGGAHAHTSGSSGSHSHSVSVSINHTSAPNNT